MTTTCYTVHDRAGFDALPAGTKLEDADGDCFEKMVDGYREFGDAAPYYNHLYIETPAVVLNPEVLGTIPLEIGTLVRVTKDGDLGRLDRSAPARLFYGAFEPGALAVVIENDLRNYDARVRFLADDVKKYVNRSQIEEVDQNFQEGDRVQRFTDTHILRKGHPKDWGDAECSKGSVGTVTKYKSRLGDGVGVTWDRGKTPSSYSVISASQLAPYVDPEPEPEVFVVIDNDGDHWVSLTSAEYGYALRSNEGGATSLAYIEQVYGIDGGKPEPVRENFDMAGAYVRGQEALDALPALSIVDPLGAYLPMLKLRSGEWVSIGLVSKTGPTTAAGWVEDSVAEQGGVVLYANPENA